MRLFAFDDPKLLPQQQDLNVFFSFGEMADGHDVKDEPEKMQNDPIHHR
jgi:hypothetical protein